MKEQILVPLKRRDQIEEVMPYVEKIVGPGMTVIFLIRSSSGNWPRMEAFLATMHTGNTAVLPNYEAKLQFEYERERRLAEERLEAFNQKLGRKGVQAHVRIYPGGLSRILRNFTRHGNIRLVVIPAGGSSLWIRLLEALRSSLGLIRQPSVCPVLLFHPNRTFQRQ
jgi:hypothetical protein